MSFRRPLWVFSVIVSLMVPAAGAQPSLGTASSFVVLGTAAGNSGGTIVTGNVGASAGAVTGFSTPFVAGDAVTGSIARQAHDDALAAYNALAAIAEDTPPALSGFVPVTAGVHRVKSSLVLAPGTQLHLSGDATTSTVFWVVDGDVTVGARSTFVGTILARGSITFGRDVSLSGRAIALGGPVTADTDNLTLCCDPLDITPPASTAVIGKPLSPAMLHATGGTEPYKFAFFDGALPPGLALLGDGTLSGTPTATGTYTATVRASDDHGCSSLRTFDINVCGPTVLPEQPLQATMCVKFEATVANGTFAGQLPAGIPLPVNGKLSGTPTQCGDFLFSITWTDANGCTFTQPYRLHVDCAIAPAPPPLPNGTIGHPYKADITPICGEGPFQYELIKGSLPPDLTGPPLPLITGIPKKPGTYAFTIKITGLLISTTVDYTITIVCDALTFSPAVLPSGNTCDAYNQTVTVSGGLPPYTFAVTGLPPDLAFSPPNGNAVTISGLPAQDGVFDVVLRATDAAGCTAPWSYRLTITKPSTLTILPPTLPPAQFLVFYSQTLSTTCGVPPIEYAITKGAPPAGINLCPPDTICGTPPLTALSSNFTVSAVDKLGTPGTRDYTICLPITILPETLPDAIAGRPYMPPYVARGGAGPFDFDPVVVTPPAAGVLVFTATATDQPTGCHGSRLYTLNVRPACAGIQLTPSSTLLPFANVGIFYSQNITAAGGTPPYQFRVVVMPAQELPSVVTLAANGTISGVPTTPGHYNFAIVATDATGFSSCSEVYTIEVLP